MYKHEQLEASRKHGFEDIKYLQHLYQKLLRLEPGSKVLDVACGTGFFTRILAGIPGVQATGLDLQEDLLQAARQHANDKRLNISFVLGNALDLPFEDHHFDCVTSHIFLEVFDDVSLPLLEMKRVCKPGGRVCCMEPVYTAYIHFSPLLTDEENQALSLYWQRGRKMGAGVLVPDAMARAGLQKIETLGWFWGGIRQGRLMSAQRMAQMRQEVLDNQQSLFNVVEQKSMLSAIDKLLMTYNQGDDAIENNMNVSGMPVLITNGIV